MREAPFSRILSLKKVLLFKEESSLFLEVCVVQCLPDEHQLSQTVLLSMVVLQVTAAVQLYQFSCVRNVRPSTSHNTGQGAE